MVRANTIAGFVVGWLLASVSADAQCLEATSQVAVTSNVVYGTAPVDDGADTIDLLLDLYEPAGDDRPDKPAVVLIHGGSFTGGSKTNSLMVQLGQLLAARGFVAASIEYRLFGDTPPIPDWMQSIMDAFGIGPSHPEYPRYATVHAAGMDTRTAVRWLRENAVTYGIDPTRVAAIGSSAGAFCSLNAGAIDGNELNLVDFDRLAPGDPISYPSQSSNTDVTVDLWGTLTEPLNWTIDADDAPIMIVHGTNDSVVPYSEAIAIADRATAVGLDHELWPLVGVGHGAPLSTDLDGEPMSQRIVDFLRTRLDLCRCGNEVVEPGEECDLGNESDPCCQQCSYTVAPCDDGQACTHSDTCSEGSCVGDTQPDPSCITTVPGARPVLLIRNRSGVGRDVLSWRWKRGGATTPADLGDPTATSDYAMCVYAGPGGSAELVYQADLPAGSDCAGRDCWRDRNGKGFDFKDADAVQGGLRSLKIRSGQDGRAKIKALAKTGFEAAALLPMATPVTVQVRRLDSDVCWGATHSETVRNDSSLYKGRGN